MNTNLATFQFGSMLYGTNDENSDIDLKTIYLPSLNGLLIGEPFPNYKQRRANENGVVLPGEVEIEFVALQRLALDFYEGQTYAFEIVFSAYQRLESVQYATEYDTLFKVFIDELVESYMNADLSKMVGYAYHQSRMYGIKGVRLNSAIKLKSLLVQQNVLYDGQLRLSDLIEEISTITSTEIEFCEINGANPTYKFQPGLRVNDTLYPMTSTVLYVIKQLDKMIGSYGERAKKASEEGDVDWKAMSHAVRIVYQVNEILQSHRLLFPLDIAPYLRDIKQGKVDFNEVIEKYKMLNINMEELLKNSTLKPKTPELTEEFNSWLTGWISLFYRPQFEQLTKPI